MQIANHTTLLGGSRDRVELPAECSGCCRQAKNSTKRRSKNGGARPEAQRASYSGDRRRREKTCKTIVCSGD